MAEDPSPRRAVIACDRDAFEYYCRVSGDHDAIPIHRPDDLCGRDLRNITLLVVGRRMMCLRCNEIVRFWIDRGGPPPSIWIDPQDVAREQAELQYRAAYERARAD